jgi:cystathionine beta-lyase/cystathionine gamma-synthase
MGPGARTDDGRLRADHLYLKDGTVDKITRFCEGLQHFLMAVSWGGHESLIIPKVAGMKPSDFDPRNREHQAIRLYTGLEDPFYLTSDLEQALNNI